MCGDPGSVEAEGTIALDRAHNLSRIWDKHDGTVITHPEGPLSHRGPRGLQRRK